MKKYIALGCHNSRRYVICQDDDIEVLKLIANRRLQLSKKYKVKHAPKMIVEIYEAKEILR